MKHEKRPQHFSLQLLILLAPDVPHQSNSNDCGVFLLEFMKYIAQGKPYDFSCSDMPHFREEIREEIENKVIREVLESPWLQMASKSGTPTEHKKQIPTENSKLAGLNIPPSVERIKTREQ